MFRIYSSRNVTFILHRATGTALLSGPQAFTSVMAAFRHPAFRAVEAVIVACIAFHGINGLMMIGAERGWWKR